MTETQAAYLAGLIDGEGSIKVTLGTNNRGTHYIYGRMTLGMCDLSLMQYVQALGNCGNIYVAKHPNNPTWKECYRLEWSSNKAATVLKQLLPYLRLKKRQAEILIEWQEITRTARKYVGGSGRHDRTFPPHIIETRDRLLSEMKALNRRGR